MPSLDREEFIRTVQNRADLSFPDANAAIAAVLGTLAERISGGQFADLVAYLPGDVGRDVAYDRSAPAQGFDAQEFLRRVGERLDMDLDDAEGVTHAVLSAVSETVGPNEAGDARSEVPTEIKPLLEEIGRARPGRRR